ncbi:MAG: cell wall metabolism sensor histidine kinase WalK [Clostridiales Family XIII bacterium]|jgi:two-component system sensor histidine kinase VicK|nr:cell wall metabolism sensor histidine kinase WalK [Clostridiales Family XIII bacterium]
MPDRDKSHTKRQDVFFRVLTPTAAGAGVFLLLGAATPLGVIASAFAGLAAGSALALYFAANLHASIEDTEKELHGLIDVNLSETIYEKNKLETILRYMTDGTVAVDTGGRIIHANKAARKILRMTDDDVRRKRYDDIILRFTDSLTLGAIISDLADGKVAGSFSYGGASFDVSFGIFKNSSGDEGGVIIIFRDVTESRKVQDMQVDFVANVSHELKTPLTSIKGYAETLLEGGIDDPAMTQEALGIINSEVDRMKRIVNDLLQLSRLDTKRQVWNMKPADIVALVRMAAKKQGVTAGNKRQQLNFISRDKSFILTIDRDRIEQVVTNIISNAVKYTREGGRIDVEIVRDEANVYIIVIDNGIGISELELSRIFERFYTGNKARSGDMSGTGLGLPISKQIVEEHRGSIDIQSGLGYGTRVVITLPIEGAGPDDSGEI